MKETKKDKFVDRFCNYLYFKEDRGKDITIEQLGAKVEHYSWVTDILMEVVYKLSVKKVLSKKDLEEIFWHRKEKL